jgi:hypothetical protein
LKAIIHKLRSTIEAVERDGALFEDANFSNRVAALDSLEFDVIKLIESVLVADDSKVELLELVQKAQMVKTQLESVDEALFRRLRGSIASHEYTAAGLRRLFVRYAGGDPNVGDEGYDTLDVLVNGVLLMDTAPPETQERDPEMVFYQPTPARVVLELVDRADFQPHDVFYDIGSGLGQVAILVHLLGGVRSQGVEIEPAYCDYARRCSQKLSLPSVEFLNIDAREADYSDGTVFFLYTPFEGRMLEQVLKRLQEESKTREIRLFTYGPCTLQATRHNWLERVDQNSNSVHQLATFKTGNHVSETA